MDTLTASAHLRRLRDLELLEQKGRGNATYYIPTPKLITGGVKVLTPHISSLNGELTPHISSLNGEKFTLPEGLTEDLKNKIHNLKKRTSPQEIKNLIKELCSLRPFRLSEIAAVLGRDPKYVREKYLNDMVKNQELAHAFSDPNHPQQAYRTKKS